MPFENIGLNGCGTAGVTEWGYGGEWEGTMPLQSKSAKNNHFLHKLACEMVLLIGS